MRFDLPNHLSEIEGQLAVISAGNRLTFALWCSFAVLREFPDALARTIGSKKTSVFLELLNNLWAYVTEQKQLSRETIVAAHSAYAAIESDEFELISEDEREKFGTVELLGCIQSSLAVYENGSAESAAKCAEHVINCRDHELAFVMQVKAPLSHPEFAAEAERQKRMIEHLQVSGSIAESDKYRFR